VKNERKTGGYSHQEGPPSNSVQRPKEKRRKKEVSAKGGSAAGSGARRICLWRGGRPCEKKKKHQTREFRKKGKKARDQTPHLPLLGIFRDN